MNYKKLAVLLVLVVVLARPAWSVAPKPLEISDDVKAVAKGSNEFAADLYARLRSDESTNLFFSPYSISAALTMTCAGAEGATEKQMAEVLHFPLPEAKLNRAMGTIRNLLRSSDTKPRFELRVANRLWGQKGFVFQPEFLQVTRDDYGADLGLLDFREAEAARKTINSWIEKQTADKIQDLLAPGVLTADTRLVLTNAIYFKARWAHEFSQGTTADAPFHISDSQQVTVPTMRLTDRLRYEAADNVRVLELPYVGNVSVSMLILLPTQLDGLADLEKQLTAENLQKWSADLRPQVVKVHLPRFKMISEFSLSDVLKSMGMSLAFSQQADFSGMSTQKQLFISAVIHKAFVDVNEEGTEAAAATAIMNKEAAMPAVEEPLEFRADHPLIFLIRDNRTQSILFLGRLVNPKT